MPVAFPAAGIFFARCLARLCDVCSDGRRVFGLATRIRTSDAVSDGRYADPRSAGPEVQRRAGSVAKSGVAVVAGWNGDALPD